MSKKVQNRSFCFHFKKKKPCWKWKCAATLNECCKEKKKKKLTFFFFFFFEFVLLVHFPCVPHSTDDYKCLFDGSGKFSIQLRNVWFCMNAGSLWIVWDIDSRDHCFASTKLSNFTTVQSYFIGCDVAIFPTIYLNSFNEETTLPQKFPALCAHEWMILFSVCFCFYFPVQFIYFVFQHLHLWTKALTRWFGF